jgi:GT2 family glycosyltransferase
MSIRVMVPTYHRPKYAAGCLEALRNQARAPDWVLVVDIDPFLRTATRVQQTTMTIPARDER